MKLENTIKYYYVEKNSSSAAAQDRKKWKIKRKERKILTNVGEICECFLLSKRVDMIRVEYQNPKHENSQLKNNTLGCYLM